ncbi:hypothetical protein ZWY2020_001901 [Hordeum vulgare]|nr:hypothetical protein ZWY2020_001901 [Hordeum vulgare]
MLLLSSRRACYQGPRTRAAISTGSNKRMRCTHANALPLLLSPVVSAANASASSSNHVRELRLVVQVISIEGIALGRRESNAPSPFSQALSVGHLARFVAVAGPRLFPSLAQVFVDLPNLLDSHHRSVSSPSTAPRDGPVRQPLSPSRTSLRFRPPAWPLQLSESMAPTSCSWECH